MAVIISSGTSTVSSGSILTSPSILSAGEVWVRSGGKVVSANIYSSGHEYVYSGGIDSGASIYNYGSMRIALSGSAVNPCVASGGVLNVDEGAVLSAVVLSRGLLNVCGRSSAAGITRGYAYNTVVSGGSLFANQYATISNTLINNRGIVSLCGVAESTTIGLSGHLYVSSGGKASNTVVDSGGIFWVYSGGTANNNRVSAGGLMDIDPSGFAYNNYISSGGELNVNHDGIVLSTTVYDGGRVLLYSGGFASETTLSSGTLVVIKSATADMVTVYNGGFAVFSSGATGSSIKENGGYVNVQSGANVRFQAHSFSANITHDATVHKYTVASAATVYSGGRLNVLSGGEATSVFANFSGTLNVSSGGRAMNTTVNNSGTLNLSSGGTAEYTLVNNGGTMNFYDGGRDHRTTVSGTLNVSSGGTAYETTVFGKANVFSDGVMSSATVSSGGTMNVSSGGSAVRTTTFGTMLVGYRGIASRVNVVSNGSLVVSLGGKVTGELSFASGGSASFQSGGILDFDITTLDNNSGVLVTNYSLISGTPECTLTVSDSQSNGTYMLATSASGFDRTITVKSAAGTTLGTLTVDGTLEYNGRSYTLALSGTLLTVTVDNSIFTGDLIDETKDITLGLRASSVNILSSGVLNVYARGTAEVTTVNSGGVFNVNQGGIANDTVVNSCGSMYVGNGGNVVSTVINNTGALFVSMGGVAVSTTIAADGGYLCISSGGSAVDTLAEYSFLVYNGASASNTTVKGRGWMDLGGSSLNAIILSGGSLEIAEYESSAFASATTVRDGGRMIVGNGTVRGAMIIEGGVMDVSGGTVNDIGVESTGILNVSGVEATLVRVNNGGTVVVVGGGTVNGLSLINGTADVNGTVNAGTIAGGTLRLADYGSGAQLYVEGGEVFTGEHGYFNGTIAGTGVVRIGSAVEVYNTTVQAGGRITGSIQVNRGGLTFAEGGVLNFDISDISPDNDALVTNYSLINGTPICTLTVSDSQANGTYNLATGAADFSEAINVMNTSDIQLGLLTVGRTVTIAGTDYTLNLDESGLLTVTVCEGGGTVDITGDLDTQFSLTGGMYGSSVNILSGGILDVLSGGSADNTTIKSGGMMNVYSSGSADVTTVSSGGTMAVYFDGTADHTIIESGGTAHIYYDGVMSNTVINSYGFLALSDNGSAVDTTINYDGEIGVYSGGVVNSTAIHSKGLLILYSGGTANDTTMMNNGSIYVSRWGIANNVTVYDGLLYINDKGTANSVTLSGGSLFVYSGGTVTNLDWTPCEGRIDINSGAQVTFVSEYSGVYYGENDRLVSHAEVMNLQTVSGSRTRMYVMSGGTANDTMLSHMGGIFVCSGGVANDTTLGDSFASMYVSGGIVNNVTVNGGGTVIVSSGVLSSVTINSGGMNLGQGARAFDVTLNGSSWMYLFGYANNIAVNAANLHVVVEGYACNAAIGFGGSMGVSSGCSAYYTSVCDGGAATVLDGGIMRDLEVYAGGVVFADSGATLTGSMFLETGAAINAAAGAIIDYDLSLALADGPALITDLSLITGAPTYTLSVSGVEMEGVYNLAGGAAGFAGTISVHGLSGESYGSFGVGQTISINEMDYTLVLNDSTLSVAVGPYTPPGPEPPTPTADRVFFNGDFNGDGLATLAVETPEQVGAQPASVTIYQNGEPWGLGLAMDYGWEVVGVGDFSGDDLDDFLRVNAEGYVVGEMSNGNGTFSPQVLNLKNAGWDILGVGDFNGNGTDDVLIANPTGASEIVGLLGYWESGVTWTLINGYSAEWEMVATGDYNGDGKCDMLWRNQFEGDGGGTYNAYCTWIVDNPVDWRMVSVANPSEWNFLCSGDFNGDKMNDIAMINDVGVVGIWGVNDGYLSSWSILSAVTSEWQLAGVADFNGDGTDDIAWSNTDTGLTGYWQINNKELTTWANIATLG